MKVFNHKNNEAKADAGAVEPKTLASIAAGAAVVAATVGLVAPALSREDDVKATSIAASEDNQHKIHLNESAVLLGIEKQGADVAREVQGFGPATVIYTEPNPESPTVMVLKGVKEEVSEGIPAVDPVSGDHFIGFKPAPLMTDGQTIADQYVWIDTDKNPAEAVRQLDGGGMTHIQLDGVGITTDAEGNIAATGAQLTADAGKATRTP